MTETNHQLSLHDDTAHDTVSFLTEFAQLQRITGNHEKAARAEAIRNTINSQTGFEQ